MNSLLVVFTIAMLSVVASAALQQSSGAEQEDIYRKIPENQQQPLKQALNKLVEAEKAGDWKSVYDSIDKHSGETEDKFVTKMKGLHLLREFRPSKVTFMPPDSSWNIQGCASFEGRSDRSRTDCERARPMGKFAVASLSCCN